MENYGVQSKRPTDNDPELLSKLFMALCGTVGVNNFTTAEYPSQANGPAECFNYTLNS